jgi:hypothetical protein
MASNTTYFNSLGTASASSTGNVSANQGLVLSNQNATVTYGANGTTTTICTIPAGAQILFINIDVTTAFNAGTTNTISIGVAGTAGQFVSATSVSATGRASVATTGQYANWGNVGTSDVTIIATYNQTGTAASAGSALITVIYDF